MLTELRNYDELFQKIKSESNTNDIDEISRKYRENYNDNYRLYHYINNMNDELNRKMEEQAEIK